MKILVDMNLSPSWISLLEAGGYETKHWSQIGSPGAPDTEIMQWARGNGFVVFTHDLDYGALLFATQTMPPSVIQLRIEDIRPVTLFHPFGVGFCFTVIVYNHAIPSGLCSSTNTIRALNHHSHFF